MTLSRDQYNSLTVSAINKSLTMHYYNLSYINFLSTSSDLR